MKIRFPINKSFRYYDIHFKWVYNLFEYSGCNIELENIPIINETVFQCYINDKLVIFDFSDNGNGLNESENDIIFKFHFKEEHIKLDNVFPFSPISFYDWNQYNQLKKEIKYTCNNDIILNNQRIYGNAIERRTKVQKLLKDNFANIDFSITDQITYWNKINNCLVSVHVPGQNPNILDRAQLQYMFLGCCTISPKLPEILAYDIELEPWVHYIPCENDYSDLIKKIEWCKNNRDKCIVIGKNVKALCKKYLTPKNLIEWVETLLGYME